MELTDVFQADRREQATDARGVPSSFARAMTALGGACAHCVHKAVVANGSGIALCAVHRTMRLTDAVSERQRLRQQIDIAKAWRG